MVLERARIARTLWIAWAVIVWNVVLDHVIVVAGRHVIATAERGETGINIDGIMRPAVTRGLLTATIAASAILVIGLSSIQLVRNR